MEINKYKDAVLRELQEMQKIGELRYQVLNDICVVQFTVDTDISEYEEGGLSVSDCATLMVVRADMEYKTRMGG